MIACLAMFVGCSKDDEDSNLGSDLYGKWRITEVYAPQYNTWLDITNPSSGVEEMYATFKTDGTYIEEKPSDRFVGTYTVNGKTIICYSQGVEGLRYEIISMSASKCELNMIAGAESMKIRCKKH
ncbi:MAG: lipocalin family protein [Rikenellaceae bacterium]